MSWTDEDIEYLKNNFPYVTPRTLEKEIGFSKEEIKEKAKELGLTKMVIRRTKTETHAPCPICRTWKPVEDFNANEKAERKLQDNCRECDAARRKETPISQEKMKQYIETHKRNKELKALKESPEYKREIMKMVIKNETKNKQIICRQCGETKLGKMFGMRGTNRKDICLACEKENRDIIKAQKILSGKDY